MMFNQLKCHPDTPCGAVTSIEVTLARPGPGAVVLTYTVLGNIDLLRLPPARLPARTDNLWQYTCFEAFFRPSPGTAYNEFNFAPSTQWAAYKFDSYRSTLIVAGEQPAPEIRVKTASGQMELRVGVDFVLPKAGSMALSAVIEETDGRKSYWALAHPQGKPDFHHTDCFACDLSSMDGK